MWLVFTESHASCNENQTHPAELGRILPLRGQHLTVASAALRFRQTPYPPSTCPAFPLRTQHQSTESLPQDGSLLQGAVMTLHFASGSAPTTVRTRHLAAFSKLLRGPQYSFTARHHAAMKRRPACCLQAHARSPTSASPAGCLPPRSSGSRLPPASAQLAGCSASFLLLHSQRGSSMGE